MKSIIIQIVFFSFFLSCKNESEVYTTNLFSNYIPNQSLLNLNNVLKNDTLVLINKKDTVKFLLFDSLGRFISFKNKRWHRVESFKYFSNSSIPVSKFISVDYSLRYNSAIFDNGKDSIYSFWYDESGVIEDTFIYIFKNRVLSEYISTSLNDYEDIKTRKKFLYKSDILIKTITKTIKHKKSVFGEMDSLVTIFKYDLGKISEVKEFFYFINKSFNYKNEYLFDKNGYPVKLIERDTIVFIITKK